MCLTRKGRRESARCALGCLQQKWYIPAGKDPEPFGQWLGAAEPAAAKADSATPVAALAANITQPADSHFVAYDGDEPPWD